MNNRFFSAVGGSHGALLLGQLDGRSLRALNADFATFHHPGQLQPDGDWRTWLIIAGRGFGKTRAGAEWVLSLVRGEAQPSPFVSSPSTACQGRRSGQAKVETPIGNAQHRGISTGLDANGFGVHNSLRIALVAATLDEARRVMVEGPSGLLRVALPGEIADWSPSRRTLIFANGAEAVLYSGGNPESLRGPEHHFAWADELAKWKHPAASWDNLQLGLRMGDYPRALVTTTPKPSALLNRLIAAPDSVRTGGATDANPHLPSSFVAAMHAQYGGSRIGLQEIEGRLLDDVEGSLWPLALIERCRVSAFQTPFVSSPVETPIGGVLPHGISTSLDTNGLGGSAQPHGISNPERVKGLDANGNEKAFFTRTVIGVDPPASAGGTCGIIVCALDAVGHGHVLADCSVGGTSPDGWAAAVVRAAQEWDADRVVAEKNQGGDMVEAVLRAASANLPLRLVHAAKGKSARAEPVAALFEQGKVWLHGRFDELEAQLGGLIAGGRYEGPGISPDRADACVWALWALMLEPRSAVPRISLL